MPDIHLSVPDDAEDTTENTPQEALEAPQEPVEGESGTDPQEDPQEGAETFSRDYVQSLRDEAAKYRTRAKRADELAAALWAKSVSELGKLADPTDLPMPEDADPLDPEAVRSAVDDLLSRKPHLATRRVSGDVGQGKGNPGGETFSLGGLLRSRA